MTLLLHRIARTLVACAVAAALPGPAHAQNSPTSSDLPPLTLALADLNAFRAPSGSWKIVGGASTLSEGRSALATTPGVGVLVHLPTTTTPATLATTWDHGDIDLSFDLMSSEGAKASVLLMGRYGLDLSDSWVNGAPTLSTIGAIAPRWSDVRGSERTVIEGTLPRQNAGRAPGLWQHVDLVFRAPRFAAGGKTSNARFVTVSVNGVVVQQNVEVTGPTRESVDRDERAAGALVFHADGGVAIRNIRYKSYTANVALSGLRYRVYEGDAMNASYASTHAPTREGAASMISPDIALPPDRFAVAWDGTMTAPTAGRYRFGLSLGWIGNDSASRGASVGGGTVTVDGAPVIAHSGGERRATGDVDLAAGTHAVALSYYKNRPQFNRRDVSITVEGPGVERQSLSDDSAVGGGGNSPINPIMVEVQAEPVLLRSFVRHGTTKRVIAMSVADPRDVHYTYDLSRGALLYVWRGPFLETTQMWHERGEDQTAEPLGSTVMLPGTPVIALLAAANAAWPDSLDERVFRRDGYQLDKTGHPTFLFHVNGVAVEDAVRVQPDGRSLHRELRLRAPSGASTNGLYAQLAQADHIERQRDGSYVVGDRAYYIVLPSNASRPVIRRVAGMDELIVPVRFNGGEGSVSYSMVW